MKKLLLALLVVSLTASVSCQKSEIDQTATLLGAEVGLYITQSNGISERERLKIQDEVYSLAEEMDGVFSLQRNGDIAKYNELKQGEKISVSLFVKEVFELSKALKTDTQNCFDPAVKHFVDLWGFSYRYAKIDYAPSLPFDREKLEGGGFELPDNRYIDGFLTLSDLDIANLKEENGAYFLEKGSKTFSLNESESYNHALDFSAVVKGYFCDKAVEIIKSRKATNFYLTVGGSSLYLGENQGGEWELRLVDPFKEGRQTFAKVKIKNAFVSASGTYENNYQVDGKIYSHVIDPRTGKPVDGNLVSATVICQSGAYTDAVATALVVMGREKALEYLKGKAGVYYVLVDEDGEIYSNLGDALVLENE